MSKTNTNEVEVMEVETVNETVNALDVVRTDNTDVVAMFENPGQVMFSSIIDDGKRETKIKIFSAVNDAENSLSDHLGETLEITDIVAHAITLQDEITKEDVQAMRVVLLTADGEGYHSVSQGVVSALQKIIGIVGQAPWTPALKVVPVEKKTRKGFKTLTLKLV